MFTRNRAAGAAGAALILFALAACADPAVDTSTRTDEGEIAEAGTVGVYKLQVGDCVNDPSMLEVSDETTEIAQMSAVPCSDLHTGEVVLADAEYFATAEDSYPGEEVIASRSTEACVTALGEYTATVYEDSNFDVMPIYPIAEGWSTDRGLTCVGVVLSENTWLPIESTGSIKAA